MNSQFHSTEVAALFGSQRQLGHMLAFEGALATVQGELGLIPDAAARAIAAVCVDRKLLARIDLSAAAVAGNPAIPFVQQLTAQVRSVDADAAAWVHRGATSQDVIDTAHMLALRETLNLVQRDLLQLRETLATLARTHAATPLIARTLLQQATPTTLGHTFATALAGLDRIASRLEQLRHTSLLLQLGGPVGTLASAGSLAPKLVLGVATRLDLKPAPISWHTQRFAIVDCGSTLAALAGLLGKMSRDVILSMQSEVGELAEASAGGSTAMPHKRNPVHSVAAVAAATVAPQLAAALLASMSQEHERAAGAWHAEWIVLPQLCSLTHGALQSTLDVFRNLRIDTPRMQTNLAEASRMTCAAALADLIAPTLGRDVAHEQVKAWSQTALTSNRTLREVALQELAVLNTLPSERIDAVFSIDNDVAAAQARTLNYLQQRNAGAAGHE